MSDVTNGSTKPEAKPTAKPKKAKPAVPTKAALQKLVGKRVKYTGRNVKWNGKMVEVKSVRTTKLAPHGYDVLLALGDSTQYCSVTSVKLA